MEREREEKKKLRVVLGGSDATNVHTPGAISNPTSFVCGSSSFFLNTISFESGFHGIFFSLEVLSFLIVLLFFFPSSR